MSPEWEVRGSRPTAAVLCPWARHFTPRKYWLITQEAMAPSRHDWKIVDWDVKPQHNQPNKCVQIYLVVKMHRKEKKGGKFGVSSCKKKQKFVLVLLTVTSVQWLFMWSNRYLIVKVKHNISCIRDKVVSDFHQCRQTLSYITSSDPWVR